MDYANSKMVESTGEVVVTLDCESLVLPAGRASLNSIRAYLDSIALARQRVLGEFVVDGCVVDLSLPLENRPFRRVDAVTVSLSEQPLLLLTTAEQQAGRARAAVDAALTLVLINDPFTARELWWRVAAQLKEDAELKDIPIVFLTALVSGQENVTGGLIRSGYRFIGKLASEKEILQCIEENIR